MPLSRCFSLLNTGYLEEARAWRAWLLRAVAGRPDRDRRSCTAWPASGVLTELELPWLPGYEGSQPVRVGNAASGQFQLDVYGEVIDALYHGPHVGPGALRRRLGQRPGPARVRRTGLAASPTRGSGRCAARGGISPIPRSWPGSPSTAASRQSKNSDFEGPLERWKELRDTIHAQVCREGFRRRARLLRAVVWIARAGCQPAHDAAGRLPARQTTRACAARWRPSKSGLVQDGFVARYIPARASTACRPARARFCPAPSGWPTTSHLMGREAEARRLFERLLGMCNDVGLHFGRVRPDGGPAARQLSAGVLARGPGQFGPQSVAGARAGGNSANELVLHAAG